MHADAKALARFRTGDPERYRAAMLTNDYSDSARQYALRGITGTDSIAFHAIAERAAELKLSGRALDFGCGSGRSTRFLKALAFETSGVDVSEAKRIRVTKYA